MKLKEKVKYILEKHPDSRNSDIRLWQLLVWEFYNSNIVEVNGDKAIKMKDLFDLPRFSDTQRHRAYYQNIQHIFLPTSEEVLKQRKINEFYWHTEMSDSRSNPSRG
jgi:hypothetical protein